MQLAAAHFDGEVIIGDGLTTITLPEAEPSGEAVA